jgi:hypothetical protein
MSGICGLGFGMFISELQHLAHCHEEDLSNSH